jgi:hypothetical protein
MADVDPAAAENLRHLPAQNVLGNQDFAVEEEGLPLAIVDDIGASGHGSALGSHQSAASNLRSVIASQGINAGPPGTANAPQRQSWIVDLPTSIPLALFGGLAKHTHRFRSFTNVRSKP